MELPGGAVHFTDGTGRPQREGPRVRDSPSVVAGLTGELPDRHGPRPPPQSFPGRDDVEGRRGRLRLPGLLRPGRDRSRYPIRPDPSLRFHPAGADQHLVTLHVDIPEDTPNDTAIVVDVASSGHPGFGRPKQGTTHPRFTCAGRTARDTARFASREAKRSSPRSLATRPPTSTRTLSQQFTGTASPRHAVTGPAYRRRGDPALPLRRCRSAAGAGSGLRMVRSDGGRARV